jgi:hypothetical protein
LYERKLLVMREKDLRAIISGAIRQFEAKLGRTIQADVGTAALERWQETLVQARECSQRRSGTGVPRLRGRHLAGAAPSAA